MPDRREATDTESQPPAVHDTRPDTAHRHTKLAILVAGLVVGLGILVWGIAGGGDWTGTAETGTESRIETGTDAGTGAAAGD